VVVSQSGLLDREEVRKIKEEAKKYKAEDLKKKEMLTRETKILNHIFAIEKMMKGMSLERGMEAECKQIIERGKASTEKEDIPAMEAALKELFELNNRLSSLFETVKESDGKAVSSQPPSSLKTNRTDTRPLGLTQNEAEDKRPDSDKQNNPGKKMSDTQPIKLHEE